MNPRRLGAVLAAVQLALVAAGLAAQPGPEPPAAETAPATPSPRNVSYTIEARLDADAKTLDGRQVLTWRNIQPIATDELWFHLYWNAWRNERSTWMLEDRFRKRSGISGAEIGPGDWGWIEVDEVRLLGEEGAPAADLTASARFAAPDDGNPDDRTVMVVALPREVAPGETVRLEMAWRAKIPRTFARTGFRGDFFFIAHWFPKLGVLEPTGWSCHQYHAATEYYSDYGVYDVSITVPDGYVLGATGRRIESREGGDGTVTYRHVQEDVHAFTWTASPDYVEIERRFEEPGLPPIDIRLLMQPEHLEQSERHLAAVEGAFRLFGTWYGPYPYGHVTVVDPAWGSGAGGMEYPTLFTCGTRLFNPAGGGSPESVTIHEAGHQFWYAVVGNDEFEHAWLDEGLNTYSTLRVLSEIHGNRRLVQRFFLPAGIDSRGGRRTGFLPWLVPGIERTWAAPDRRLNNYRRSARSDVPSDPTWRQFPSSASDLTYSKAALWLMTLERHLGWETVRRILATFFERWKFRHPEPEDFFAVAEEVTGGDLDWFFDQVYRSEAVFDYAVTEARSGPAPRRGWFGDGSELALREPAAGAPQLFRSEVVVRRMADGVFPVEVRLTFEDGSEVREPWDGRELWKLFVHEGPVRLERAEVDPERVLVLDLDWTNNSRYVEPRARFPAVKWASKWLTWLQDFLLTVGFFT